MTQTYTPLIYVLAFVAVVVLIQTSASIFFAAKDRIESINRRLALLGSGLSQDEVYSTLVRRNAVGPSGGTGLLQRLHDRIDIYCRQADLNVTPTRLLTIVAGIAGAMWLFGLTVVGLTSKGDLIVNGLMSLIGACALSALGVWTWVRGKHAARLKKIQEQLPLALDIVNRAVRAGHPVVAAVELAADEMGDPLGSEFGLIVDETTYGVEFKEALNNFARRTGSSDAHYFSICVGIQSETGGNLAEILEGLARVMRARSTLAQRIQALASEGRTSAYMLSALPFGMIGFQLLVHPTFYTDKFADPIFWPTVVIVGITYIFGWFWIQRIINFKY